jgi:hypothetical protein
LKETKELKEFVLVLLGDSHTCILNCYLEEAFLSFSDDLNLYVNFSPLCKLESIGLQTNQDLHDSLLVGIDHEVMLPVLIQELVLHLMLFSIVYDVYKSGMQPDLIVLSLPLLNDHDFLHC